ncbi:6355_t:CDS:2 [Paraglomus occultum]|uniref:6355_t:CDS:1 n=1 Tax=Paraglomus occultum TaxID=144539 RepID=A0A9N9CTQ7_9GLOM|nr:6355_t:CDS:2 [Paraglomus occultum]
MPQYSYNSNRLKVQLKLTINRLKLSQQKKNSLNKQARKEIATLLENGKEESARIRVEGIIREDLYIEAMELLELYCELLLARFGLIDQNSRTCDSAIIEAVSTLIYAAPRMEIVELQRVREQLITRFGKEFLENITQNKLHVNDRVVVKLEAKAPALYLVNRYLEEIAKSYNVDWVLDTESESLITYDLLIGGNNSSNGNAESETYTALPDLQAFFMDSLKTNGSSISKPLDSSPKPSVSLPETLSKRTESNPIEKSLSDIFSDDPNTKPPPYEEHKNDVGIKTEKAEDTETKKNGKIGDDLPETKKNGKTGDDLPETKKNGKTGDDLPDFDELARRFEALKRK